MTDGERPLEGAVDLHVHTSPDLLPRCQTDVEYVEQAQAAGMRGVVLKNHHFATTDRAKLASRATGSDFEVMGGLVLNATACGGLNPDAVWANLELGAKIIWLPTSSAQHHLSHLADNPGGHLAAVTARKLPVHLFADDGSLLPALVEILKMVSEHNAVLASGHLHPRETLIIFRRAKDLGVERLLVTHPELPLIGMTPEEQIVAAGMGAYLERCYLSLLTGYDPAEMVRSIRAAGSGRTILSTDLGQDFNPPPIDGYVDFKLQLTKAGLTANEWNLVASTNATDLLDLNRGVP